MTTSAERFLRETAALFSAIRALDVEFLRYHGHSAAWIRAMTKRRHALHARLVLSLGRDGERLRELVAKVEPLV